ncbi:hypothetical protein ABMY26_04325 [Azospirillum sp. HJ39]|uniref:hypothetical protein n=1 Tax=Azospirillum sp. HJ39 TaxID=3159496 RepID=UPI0035581069
MTSLPNDSVLPVVGDSVSIGASLLPEPFQTALSLATGGTGLNVANATRTATSSSVSVTGTASFLGQSGAAVTATIETDPTSGAVTGGQVAIQVAGGAAAASGWSFATSFPNLPPFLSSLTSSETGNAVGSLSFSVASFLLSADGATDPATGVSVPAGLAFAGEAEISPFLGVVSSWVTGTSSVTLAGPIVLPAPTAQPMPVPWTPGDYPWTMSPRPPGLYLSCDLDLSFDIPDTKLSLSKGAIQLYTPDSGSWMQANPGYFPDLAVTAHLSIPSTGQHAKIVVADPVGNTAVNISGYFTGFTLSALADLADLVCSGDIAGALPSDVVSSLQGISLQSISLQLSESFALQAIGISVQLAGASTGAVTGYSIDSLVADFGLVPPFVATDIGVNLTGQFTIWGQKTAVTLMLPQDMVTASLPDGVSIDFSTIASDLSLPSGIPDLTINSLDVTLDFSGDFSVEAAIADSPPWVLELGPTSVTASDIYAAIVHQNQTWSGGFSGTFAFGDSLTLNATAVLPGSFQLTANLENIGLTDLMSALTSVAPFLPSSFDLTFQDVSILIQDNGSALEFMLAATVQGFGTGIVLVNQDASQQWGIVVGMNVDGGAIASIPGLDLLSSFAGFTLTDLILVVSSGNVPGFSFPGLSVFSNAGLPVPPTGVNLPSQVSGLVDGLNFYGQWQLDSQDQQQGLLSSLLGIDAALDIILQVSDPPENDTRFAVTLSENSQGDSLSIGGQPLICTLAVQIVNDVASLDFSGEMTCTIQGTTQLIDVELEWAENGAFIFGSMTSSETGNAKNLPQTISFGSLQLADVMLMVGIDWEGVPSLGFAATIEDEDDGVQASLTVILNSADPTQSVIAGSISPITLDKIFSALLPGVGASPIGQVLAAVSLVGAAAQPLSGSSLAADLNGYNLTPVVAAMNAAGFSVSTTSSNLLLVLDKTDPTEPISSVNQWGLTDISSGLHYTLSADASGNVTATLDPQFTLALATTTIAGNSYQKGMFLAGGLQVEDFVFQVIAAFYPDVGFYIDASINDPLVIGPAGLFSIGNADMTAGPQLTVCTFTGSNPVTKAQMQPQFNLSGSVSLLGATASILIDVTENGFSFSIDTDLLDIVTASLSGSYNSSSGLSITGSLEVGIKSIDLRTLGSIPIDTSISVTLTVSAGSGSASVEVSGSLTLFGHSFSVPSTSVTISATAMENMAETIAGAVANGLIDFYNNDVQAWVDDVKSDLITGVEDIESILESEFNQTEDQVKKLLQDAQACSVTSAAMSL